MSVIPPTHPLKKAILALSLAALPLPAANILFNDLTDSITVTGTGFSSFTSAASTNCVVDATACESRSFTGLFTSSAGFTGAGSGIAFLFEPGTHLLSDVVQIIFQCQAGNCTVNGFAVSDAPGGTLGGGPAGIGTPETGTVLDLTVFLDSSGAPITLPPGLTVQALSDTEIPEPASWGLVSLVLGALAVFHFLRCRV